MSTLAVGVELVVELLLDGCKGLQRGGVVLGLAKRRPVGQLEVQDDEAVSCGRDRRGW